MQDIVVKSDWIVRMKADEVVNIPPVAKSLGEKRYYASWSKPVFDTDAYLIKEIIISDGFEEINNSAFSNACNLSKLVIPYSVSKIGSDIIDKNIQRINIEIYSDKIDKICINSFSASAVIFAPNAPFKAIDGPLKKNALICFSKRYKEYNELVFKTYVSYLKKQKAKALEYVKESNDLLSFCLNNNIFENYETEELILYFGKNNNVEALSYLVEYHSSLNHGDKNLELNTKSNENDWKYKKIADNEAVLISYCGNDLNVKVPGFIKGMPVKMIGEYCFSPKKKGISSEAKDIRKNIESIEIEEGIEEIKGNAFDSCIKLKNLMLPNSLKHLDYCLDNCKSLKILNIKNSTIPIDSYVSMDGLTIKTCTFFDYLESLEEIEVSITNREYTSIDGILYDNSCGFMRCPIKKQGVIKLKEDTKYFYGYSLFGCKEITDILLSKYVIFNGLNVFRPTRESDNNPYKEYKHITIHGYNEKQFEWYKKQLTGVVDLK